MLSENNDEIPPGGHEVCPIVSAVKQIGTTWNLIVIRYMFEKPMGFNEILRSIEGINSKTLSRVLKHLQEMGIITRTVLSTQPFSVQYALTEKGRSLEPVMDSLREWGDRWVLKLRTAKEGTRAV